MEIFHKITGLNLQTSKTRNYLWHRNIHYRPESICL